MRKEFFFLLVGVLICFTAPGQEPSRSPADPLFIRATVYPTFSLARYDIDTDRNKVELRVYMEIREAKRDGTIKTDACVELNGQRVPFDREEKDYRRRITVDNRNWDRQLILRIGTPEGWRASLSYEIPGWLRLENPQPVEINDKADIPVAWSFSRFSFPVDVHATDFKTGDRLLEQKDMTALETFIPGDDLPDDTIIRVWITPAWFFKHYIRQDGVVRGSEINVIPWSQTFVRVDFNGASSRTDDT